MQKSVKRIKRSPDQLRQLLAETPEQQAQVLDGYITEKQLTVAEDSDFFVQTAKGLTKTDPEQAKSLVGLLRERAPECKEQWATTEMFIARKTPKPNVPKKPSPPPQSKKRIKSSPDQLRLRLMDAVGSEAKVLDAYIEEKKLSISDSPDFFVQAVKALSKTSFDQAKTVISLLRGRAPDCEDAWLGLDAAIIPKSSPTQLQELLMDAPGSEASVLDAYIEEKKLSISDNPDFFTQTVKALSQTSFDQAKTVTALLRERAPGCEDVWLGLDAAIIPNSDPTQLQELLIGSVGQEAHVFDDYIAAKRLDIGANPDFFVATVKGVSEKSLDKARATTELLRERAPDREIEWAACEITILHKAGLTEEANALFATATHKLGENFQLLMAASHIKVIDSDPTARRARRRYLAQAADIAETDEQKIEVLMRQHKTAVNLDAKRDTAADLYSIAPNDPAVMMIRANMCRWDGDYDQAREIYEALRDQSTNKYPVDVLLIKNEISRGDLAEAERMAQQMILDEPKQKDAYLLSAKIHVARGDFHKACDRLDQFLKSNFEESVLGLYRLFARHGINAEHYERILQLGKRIGLLPDAKVTKLQIKADEFPLPPEDLINQPKLSLEVGDSGVAMRTHSGNLFDRLDHHSGGVNSVAIRVAPKRDGWERE